MPAGELVTVPFPETPTLSEPEWDVNVAGTDAAAPMVTVHVPVPLHAPLHPAKTEPADAAGVSVTGVPAEKLAEHVGPQEIPPGELVMVPPPVPDLATLSV